MNKTVCNFCFNRNAPNGLFNFNTQKPETDLPSNTLSELTKVIVFFH